MLKEIRILLYF